MVQFSRLILHPVSAVAIMTAGRWLESISRHEVAQTGQVASLCVHWGISWEIFVPSIFIMTLGTAILVDLTSGYIKEFRGSIGSKKKKRRAVKIRTKRQ